MGFYYLRFFQTFFQNAIFVHEGQAATRAGNLNNDINRLNSEMTRMKEVMEMQNRLTEEKDRTNKRLEEMYNEAERKSAKLKKE